MKTLLMTTAFAIALGLSGVAFAQALSGAEAEATLKGKTFKTKDFGGEGTITWNANGSIAVDITKPDGSKVVDTGTFRFDGKGYCSTWKVLRTTEKCFTLNRKSATTIDIMNTDGSLDSTLTAM